MRALASPVITRRLAGVTAIIAAALVAIVVARAPLRADPSTTPAAPAAPDAPACRGCVLVAPAHDGRPLLVLLHGDRQAPRTLVDAFRREAAARDVALFAPACPADDGCDARSWWQWDGDPAWLDARVDALAARWKIDRDRVWIAGWSGGASYLGHRAAGLGDRYAAIALAGGGMTGDGCNAAPAPVWMLEGDRNPLHRLAVDLRAALAACGHDVSWTLVARADHEGEWQALAAKATQRALFDWLAAHPRAATTTTTTVQAPGG